MVSVCLPSDALSQHLPSYLGFSYLGYGVSLHGCSIKAQPLLLTLDEGYLLMALLCQCSLRSLNQLYLIYIYKTFHTKTLNFIFFSSAHRTSSMVDDILGHKSSLGNIISSIFFDHNTIRLDVNYRKKY